MESRILTSIIVIAAISLMTGIFWYCATNKEGFDGTQALIDGVIGSTLAETQKDKPPTDTEVVNHYKAILVYISTNAPKGLKIVYDLNNRVYGKVTKVQDDFDPRDVMKNYKNPISG
jgi:hypothetical protein